MNANLHILHPVLDLGFLAILRRVSFAVSSLFSILDAELQHCKADKLLQASYLNPSWRLVRRGLWWRWDSLWLRPPNDARQLHKRKKMVLVGHWGRNGANSASSLWNPFLLCTVHVPYNNLHRTPGS
jgi:hypothetical protein